MCKRLIAAAVYKGVQKTPPYSSAANPSFAAILNPQKNMFRNHCLSEQNQL
jgi:hypothetical protein